jgi:hypothetical protein
MIPRDFNKPKHGLKDYLEEEKEFVIKKTKERRDQINKNKCDGIKKSLLQKNLIYIIGEKGYCFHCNRELNMMGAYNHLYACRPDLMKKKKKNPLKKTNKTEKNEETLNIMAFTVEELIEYIDAETLGKLIKKKYKNIQSK